MKRSRMKSRHKPTTKIRQSAKGEECTIRLPYICNFNTETTVLCHRNGAGMGMKSADSDAAYGCHACHEIIDGRAPRPEGMSYEVMLGYFEAGIQRTREILRKKGLLTEDI